MLVARLRMFYDIRMFFLMFHFSGFVGRAGTADTQNRFLVGALPDGVGSKYLQVFMLLVRVWKPVNILTQLHLEVPQPEIGFVYHPSGDRDIKKKHSYIYLSIKLSTLDWSHQRNALLARKYFYFSKMIFIFLSNFENFWRRSLLWLR